MPNIYDVARHARVSVATVSAVVNQSAYVSPQLERRVTAAIKKLGYRPNLLARSLAKQRSHMLGMIVPDIVNPFWPEVVRGAEDWAHAAGYTLLLANTDDDPKKEEMYLSLFLAKRVDGILLTKAPGSLTPEIVDRFATARVPVVQVSRIADGLCDCDSVLMDDRNAAYESVTHLMRLGYRRIGMVGGLPGATTSERRLLGYRDALRDWKRPFDRGLYFKGDFRVQSGYEAGIALLKQRPDAVFISNYQMAVGFMKALRQYQLRCPQDIAVVTCDDYPWIDSFSPRLTTVDLPKYELGAQGAKVLIDRLAARDSPPQKLELRSVLTIRDSCGYGLRAK